MRCVTSLSFCHLVDDGSSQEKDYLSGLLSNEIVMTVYFTRKQYETIRGNQGWGYQLLYTKQVGYEMSKFEILSHVSLHLFYNMPSANKLTFFPQDSSMMRYLSWV